MVNIIIWGILQCPEGAYAEYSYGENDMRCRKAKIYYDDPNNIKTAYIRVKYGQKYYMYKYFKRYDLEEFI